jgi:hypothetical protein
MPYQSYKINLTHSQLRSLARAIKEKTSVNFRISATQLNATPNTDIGLTARQIARIEKTKAMGKGLTITLSTAQLANINKMMRGGFLPLLAGLLPILEGAASTILPALATGALSGLAGWGTNKILNKASGSGLYSMGNPGRGRGLYSLGVRGGAIGNSGYPHSQVGQYGLLPTHQYPLPAQYPSQAMSINSPSPFVPAGSLTKKKAI